MQALEYGSEVFVAQERASTVKMVEVAIEEPLRMLMKRWACTQGQSRANEDRQGRCHGYVEYENCRGIVT